MNNSATPSFLDSRNLLITMATYKIKATTMRANIVYANEPDSIWIYAEESVSIINVFMNHGIPRDKRIFIVLAPRALETPIDPSPLLDIIIKENDSGKHPPAARKVSPRTESGIPSTTPKKDQVINLFLRNAHDNSNTFSVVNR